MAFQKLDDIEIDGVKITNIYREAEYYFRTSGYNYEFFFHCDLTDADAVYDLCKKAFPEGKGHVKWRAGDIGTYAMDNDRVSALAPDSHVAERVEYYKKGCNWVYSVREGNDD